MRLLNLHLRRFGPFDDVDLVFARSAGLHLVYGSNEAGKSTSLRALLGFLFGIPGNTADDHRFPKPELRVGATLVDADGREFSFVRRKGNKDTLMDDHDTPVDEAVLSHALGSISAAAFEQLYGLSHARLVAGGADLLAGKGELGESLFAAGAGVGDLHRLRTALTDEAAGIFAPRGGVGRSLNRALDDLKEARGRIREAELLPAAWQKLLAELEDGRRRLAELEEVAMRREAEAARVGRLVRVLPLVVKRTTYLEELVSLGDAVVLPADAGEQRTKTQESLRGVERRLRELAEEREGCERDAAQLQTSGELLDHADQVVALQERLGAHEKAQADLPKLQIEAESGRREAEVLLRDLGRGASLDGVELLRVDSVTRTRLGGLIAEHVELETERRAAERELLAVRSEADRLRDLLRQAPPDRDVGGLRRLVREISLLGHVETQVATLESRVGELERKARGLTRGLTGCEAELGGLRDMRVPLHEQVAEFQMAYARLDELQRELERSLAEAEDGIRVAERRLDEAAAQGALPDEAGLQRARADRDEGWLAIKAPWLAGLLPEQADRTGMADHFEADATSADQVADRLWRDAARVAAEAGLRLKLSASRDDLTRTAQILSEHRVERDEVDLRWVGLWEPAGVQPAMPATMVAWLALRERVLEVLDERDAEAGRCARLVEQAAAALAALGVELGAHCVGEAPDDESLAATVLRAEELIQAVDADAATRAALVRDLGLAEDAVRRRTEEVAGLQRRIAGWRASWEEAVGALGFPGTARPDEVTVYLDGVQRLFEKLEAASGAERRIEGIVRDARRFGDDVAVLVGACLPALQGSEPVQAARRLLVALKETQQAAIAREGLLNRLADIERQREALRRQAAEQQEELQVLVERAGCAEVDALPEAEERSRRRQDLVEKVASLEEQLVAEGRPLTELVAQAQAADADQLPALLDLAERDRGEARDAAAQLREEVGGLQARCDANAGGDGAASAAGDAEEALARVGVAVEQYVDLKLAALLLAREIERYREEHKGPIVESASTTFARLTLGSFSGLVTGFDTKDQQVLLCRRADGHDLGVTALSDGTRDQLYLALRLASIEHRLSVEEPLPLVVDDILVNFDDDRSRAALELLGELAGKTQVLFFTHHRRLAELARSVVPVGRLQELDLDALGV